MKNIIITDWASLRKFVLAYIDENFVEVLSISAYPSVDVSWVNRTRDMLAEVYSILGQLNK